MTMVRFATMCDHPGCGARSQEYSGWATCRECGSHFCPAHVWPGTLEDADERTPETCLCGPCAADVEDADDEPPRCRGCGSRTPNRNCDECRSDQ